MDRFNVFPDKTITGTGPVSKAFLTWAFSVFGRPTATFTNCPTATTGRSDRDWG